MHIPGTPEIEAVKGPSRRDLMRAGAVAAACFAVPAIAGAAPAASDVAAARAAVYPEKAFKETTEKKALGLLYGETSPVPSEKITLDVPDIAANGAVVPANVSTSLPNVTGIALLALNNPFTLACAYKLPAGTTPTISSRLKLKETTTVIALVQSDNKLYSAAKLVKVTLGGCG